MQPGWANRSRTVFAQPDIEAAREEMSARRIPPSSGIFMSRIDQINERYTRVRASRERRE